MTLEELATLAPWLALNLTLVGAPIAAGVAVALRLTGAVRPRARYALAVAAFVVAAVAPLLATVRSNYDSPSGPATISAPGGESVEPTRLEAIALAIDVSGVGPFVLAIWSIGAAALLAREAGGHLRLARARRRWRPAPDALLSTLQWPTGVALFVDECDGPSAVGLVRRAVVVPEPLIYALEPEAARRIARHELAHARWHDPLANAAMRAARALLWVSPPLWLLQRLVATERETAADSVAVGPRNGRAAAVDYAGELVAVARLSSPARHRLAGAHFGGTNLETRVARLLAEPDRAPRVRVAIAVTAVALGTAGAVVAPARAPVTTRLSNALPTPSIAVVEAPPRVGIALPSAPDAARATARPATAHAAIESPGAAPPPVVHDLDGAFPGGDGIDGPTPGPAPGDDVGPTPAELATVTLPAPPAPPEPDLSSPERAVHEHVHRHVVEPPNVVQVRRIVVRTRS